jgi:hypothetical protein
MNGVRRQRKVHIKTRQYSHPSRVYDDAAPEKPRPVCPTCGHMKGEGYGCVSCASARLMMPRREPPKEEGQRDEGAVSFA